jgi:hypothetical protein
MSKRLLKSFARKTGKDLDEVKQNWNLAKNSVLERCQPTSPEFYPQLLIELKRNLGLEEEYLFLEKFKEMIKK